MQPHEGQVLGDVRVRSFVHALVEDRRDLSWQRQQRRGLHQGIILAPDLTLEFPDAPVVPLGLLRTGAHFLRFGRARVALSNH